jgi:plastocyanin
VARGRRLLKNSDGARASLLAELVKPTDPADRKSALLLKKQVLRIFQQARHFAYDVSLSMKIVFAVLIFAFLSIAATAGTIRGHVRAVPRSEIKQDVESGKYESRKYKFLERINYEGMADFIVYIDDPNAKPVQPPEKPIQVVIQKDATFRPHVLPVLVGTTVEWPNNDDIYHNVFSMSEAKPFDLGIYKNKEIKRVTFDKPGRVDVFCSIHTRMSCIILVLTNPFFASTDKNGNFTIPNVPPGTYELKAWHERLPAQTKTITVPESGDVPVDFVLSISGLPKY